MTDLASALATPGDTGLTAYRGRPVVRVEARVTNVGDGLSESLGVGAHELEQGDTVDLLVRCVVGPHQIRVLKGYDSDEKDAPLRLVMTLEGRTVTIVDADFADEKIAAQKRRNQQAADDGKGVQRLPGSDGWEEEDAATGATVHDFPVAADTETLQAAAERIAGQTADTEADTSDTEADTDTADAPAEASAKPARRSRAKTTKE